MSVAFDPKSTKIETHFENAVTAIHLADSQSVHCHLTYGFDDQKLCKFGHKHAIAAFGTVNVTGTATELKAWGFGFIQVVRLNSLVPGAPTDSEVAGIINSPTGVAAVLQMNAAIHNTHPNTPNRSDSTEWFINVPIDFYQQ